MIELTDGQKVQIHLIMMAVLDDPNVTDPDEGLFNVWEYLDNEGFPTHHVAQFMEQNGQMLTNKALLAKMVNL